MAKNILKQNSYAEKPNQNWVLAATYDPNGELDYMSPVEYDLCFQEQHSPQILSIILISCHLTCLL